MGEPGRGRQARALPSELPLQCQAGNGDPCSPAPVFTMRLPCKAQFSEVVGACDLPTPQISHFWCFLGPLHTRPFAEAGAGSSSRVTGSRWISPCCPGPERTWQWGLWTVCGVSKATVPPGPRGARRGQSLPTAPGKASPTRVPGDLDAQYSAAPLNAVHLEAPNSRLPDSSRPSGQLDRSLVRKRNTREKRNRKAEKTREMPRAGEPGRRLRRLSPSLCAGRREGDERLLTRHRLSPGAQH